MPVAPGETGHVRYRGPGVADWFFRDDESAAEAFHDGYFYPGDLGSVDDDGFLTLKGRSKDVIIRGGANIYPPEIERIAPSVPGVAECCVFPVPHETFGEEVGIALVLTESANSAEVEAAIAAECAVKLASYKLPRHFYICDSFLNWPPFRPDSQA